MKDSPARFAQMTPRHPALHRKPRPRIRRMFAVVTFVVAAGSLIAASDWRPVEWRGERAWESSCDGWTATVSEERARLISLTPPGGGDNLLFAELKNEFSWGGHRFWLGPQAEWKTVWPPPADWETSPAARIEAEGTLLRVVQPRTDRDYPELTRTYVWRGGALHCAVTWRDARFQGIHIVQIPPTARVRVRREVTAGLPLGYVLLPVFGRDGLRTEQPVSSEVAVVEGDTITLRQAGTIEKIGVPPQDIVAEIGRHRLVMSRGRMTGMSDRLPDRGMLTQVFVGSAESVFTEIEQLTPLAGEGEAVSEILLKPGFGARDNEYP